MQKNKKILLSFFFFAFLFSFNIDFAQAAPMDTATCQSLSGVCRTKILWGDGCYNSEKIAGEGCYTNGRTGSNNPNTVCCVSKTAAEKQAEADEAERKRKAEEAASPRTEAECKAQSGVCRPGTGTTTCTSANSEKFIGVCDEKGNISCCQTIDKVGDRVTDDGCKGINGTCSWKTDGCAGEAKQIGACTTVSGKERVCCGTPKTNPGASPNSRQYTLLEKVPGAEGLVNADLKAYLEAIYRLALILVTLSAVFMISVGGFMYLTSAGNTAQAESAKKVIFDSLIGLVIAMVAWLLLYVINPDLANPRVPILLNTSYTPSTPGPVRIEPAQPGDRYKHSEAEAALKTAGIGITSTGNCSDQTNKNCTSLEGIPKSTIEKVVKLKQSSGCSFSVTGGTEVGHKSHAPGRPIIDVQNPPCLKSFLQAKKSAGTLTSDLGITSLCATKNDQEVAYACSYIEPKPHFHLVFTL